MRIFETVAAAKAFTEILADEGVSFTLCIVTYRKRLKLPVEYKVRIYS